MIKTLKFQVLSEMLYMEGSSVRYRALRYN